MRRLLCLVIVINFFLICTPESYCYAANPKLEVDWDYFTHVHFQDRYIDTKSLHVFEKISETKNRSVYRGITVTHPYGYLINDQRQTRDSSAVGIGPVYMIRNEKHYSGKLSAALDISGGFIVYNRIFPADGRYYNFMWRIGPQLIYKMDKNSSVNIGYLFMHVSNGLKSHNPSYNARGVSLGFATKF